jgi:hypothetical protein
MTDLFNERSVRIAEATRIKLYLPGLGTGLAPEDDDDIKQGAGGVTKGGSGTRTSALHGRVRQSDPGSIYHCKT